MTLVSENIVSTPIAHFGRKLYGPILAALAYYVGAQFAFFVGTLSDKIFAPLWPPNVVLFCALFFASYKDWWLYILFAFPAHAIAETDVGMHMPELLVAFLSNALVATLNAVGLRYATGVPRWLGNLREVGSLILIAVIASPMIAALAGAFVPIFGGGEIDRYWEFWAQWFLSNALTMLSLGPAALILLKERGKPAERSNTSSLIESSVLGVALVVVSVMAFELNGRVRSDFLPALLYAPLPLVLWAAFRFGIGGASYAILVTTIVMFWKILDGASLFANSGQAFNIFSIQIYLAGLSTPMLLLGAAMTGIRGAEREIRQNEEQMALAAASANVCMWRMEYNPGRFWITDHGREMLGISFHEQITRSALLGIIYPEDRERVRREMYAAVGGKKFADYDFRILRSNQEIRWIRARSRAHAQNDDFPEEVSGTFTDVTEQKLADIELSKQRQELAHVARVSMLSELSGGIAHELTQPLSAILANAEAARMLLAKETPDLDEIITILDDIIGEDHRAGEVIHRLRSLLRKSEVKFEAIDLNALISSTERLLHNELISRRVKINLDLLADLPLVSGDSVQLQQVMINLILNAMDAMNEVAPSQRNITVKTSVPTSGEVAFELSDTGVGLDAGHSDKIFQPFFTTKERGLGLGLSLSSTIIKVHGGKLTLVNNKTRGATSTVRLPHI